MMMSLLAGISYGPPVAKQQDDIDSTPLPDKVLSKSKKIQIDHHIARTLSVGNMSGVYQNTSAGVIKWEIDPDKLLLTISGQKKISDITSSYATPWQTYSDYYMHADVNEGITQIGCYAFYQCNSLQTISLPSTLLTINENAFHTCPQLQSIVIPDSVMLINLHSNSIKNCQGLKSVGIPSCVVSADKLFLTSCPSMEYFSVSEDSTFLKSYDGAIYSKDMTILWRIPTAKTSITIPNGVKLIDIDSNGIMTKPITHLSIDCDDVDIRFLPISPTFETLEILSSVQSVNLSALLMYNLKSITVSPDNPYFSSVDGVLFDKNAQTLLSYPSARVTNNYYYSIPSTVTIVADKAFYYCWTIDTLYIPSSVSSFGYTNYDDNFFIMSIIVDQGNSHYKSIDGDLYTKDGTLLFSSKGIDVVLDSGEYSTKFTFNNSISTVTLKGSITSIGSSFTQCNFLTKITIDGNVDKITSSFTLINNLVEVVINGHVGSISLSSFSTCRKLRTVNFYGTADQVNASFQLCPQIETFTIFGSISSFAYPFYCSTVNTLKISGTVNEGYMPLFGTLQNVIIDGEMKINSTTFSNLNEIETIYLPKLFEMDENIFGDWKKLRQISVHTDNALFTSVDGALLSKDLTQLYAFPPGREGEYSIPDSVSQIRNNAFTSANFVTSLSVPAGITSFNFLIFCNSLLNKVSVDKNNAQFESIDGVVYSKGVEKLVFYPPAKLEQKYMVPLSVTTIASMALYNNQQLSELVIPASVKLIEGYAFSGCKNLKFVRARGNIQKIEKQGFSFNPLLERFSYYGNKQPEYDYATLYGCPNLPEVLVPPGYTNATFCAYDVKVNTPTNTMTSGLQTKTNVLLPLVLLSCQ